MPRASAGSPRRFSAPAFMALVATTTFPLLYLAWTSARRMDLAMPFLDGFVGFANYQELLADSRFWWSLLVSLIYTGATVVLQVAIGLALALFVMEMKRGQALFRFIAILPVVLSPAVGGHGLADLYARAGIRDRRLPVHHGRAREPELARRPDAGARVGHRDPHVAVDALSLLWSCSPASPRYPRTSMRRRGSTARMPGRGSGASPCRSSGRRSSWSSS
jgi:hypothetical protein